MGWALGFFSLIVMGVVTYAYYLMSLVLDHWENSGCRHIPFRELAADAGRCLTNGKLRGGGARIIIGLWNSIMSKDLIVKRLALPLPLRMGDSSYSRLGSARESPMNPSMNKEWRPKNYYKPTGSRGYYPGDPSEQGGNQYYSAGSSYYGSAGPKGEASSMDASRTTTSSRDEANSHNASTRWLSGALALPVAAYMLQENEANAAQMERTFIAIKPDGVQRGLSLMLTACFADESGQIINSGSADGLCKGLYKSISSC